MRLAICGHGQHGKGAVAKWLAAHTMLRYSQSTSEAAAELVFSKIGALYGYGDAAEAFADRRNHRAEWAEIIWQHNQPHGVTLYSDMLATNDVIEGIRKASELAACRLHSIVDYAVWVDGSARVAPEHESSCDLRPSDCDSVLNNNRDFNQTISDLCALCVDLSIPLRSLDA